MSDTIETGISLTIREAVIEKLTDTLKAFYPLAQRADEELEMLKKESKGQFSAIFQKDSPFSVEADRFLPYMIEVANDLATMMKVDDNNYADHLKKLMRKIQLMHQVLHKFHTITDEEAAHSTIN